LPFAPKKFGDLYFHDEAKALALAVRGAGSWGEFTIHHAPAPVFYYLDPALSYQSWRRKKASSLSSTSIRNLDFI
jgi:hypothetical protein